MKLEGDGDKLKLKPDNLSLEVENCEIMNLTPECMPAVPVALIN